MKALGAIMISFLCLLPAFAGEPLDHLVATVDRHAIMHSDVDQEARFARLLSGQMGDVTPGDEIAALDRLVDRSLIDQRIAEFRLEPVSEQEIRAHIFELRRQVPGAESDSGWHKLLENNGLTEQDVADRVADELQTLRFMDMRFRSAVRVDSTSIRTYYDQTFVPELRKQNLAAPSLAEVEQKIEQILKEQRVNNLIAEWLKTLRAQSRIQDFDPSLPVTGLEKKPPDLSDLRFLPLRITGEGQPVKP